MTSTEALAAPTPSLSQKRIFTYWLPLAASWLLMAMEMPFINGALARLSEAERMIAAFGIVASLSITIESPVISLLATSTALSRNRQHYLQVRRFTLHLMGATTLLHILMGWTPLFDVVVKALIGVPESIVEPIRLGMRIMLLWSAAIAWRRFTQGILIRFGQARYVGQGTLLRLVSSAGVATILAVFTEAAGIVVGTVALCAGVIVEAVYATWVARPLIAEKFGEGALQPKEADLSYGELVRFHSPLAATNLLFLMTNPMVGAALSRSPEPETSLAAWPVLGGLFFLTRAPAVALPEVIIALGDEPDSYPSLRTFSLRVGLACTAVLALVSLTPLSRGYFQVLIGVNDELAQIALTGAQFGLLLPLLMSGVSLFRGSLTHRRVTLPVSLAMVVELLTIAVVLSAGVALEVPGVPLAAVAFSLAMLFEVTTLSLASRRVHARLSKEPAAPWWFTRR